MQRWMEWKGKRETVAGYSEPPTNKHPEYANRCIVQAEMWDKRNDVTILMDCVNTFNTWEPSYCRGH